MPRIKVVAGVSPRNANEYDKSVEADLRAAVQAGKVHAVGSCGLGVAGGLAENADGEAVDVAARESVFLSQVILAKEFDVPLVVQANGAHERTIELLEGEGFPLQQVLVRMFHGTDDQLAAWVEAGSYVSFGGWSADDPAELNRQVGLVPADRVLVESGAPAEALDLLVGFPARCDQVVYVADVVISLVPAAQLAANAAAFYRL